ncbi:Transcriptional activator NphR [compost metagenome]
MGKEKELSKLHPLEALGVVTASRGDIRAERLESRMAPKVPFPHRHDFFQLVFISQGKGWHEIDFVRHPVKPGFVFLIRPGQVHRWELDKSTKGFIVEFNAESLKFDPLEWEIFQAVYALPDLFKIAKTSLQKELQSYCKSMCMEFEGKKYGRISILKSHLNVLIVNLYRWGAEERGKFETPANQFLWDFEKLIEMHFTKEHGVEFYARQLRISPKALTMRVHRLIGKSARDMIQDRCLLEARRYLGYTTLSITEISEVLGFQDPNYFNRFFRLRLGQSPGRFRKENDQED